MDLEHMRAQQNGDPTVSVIVAIYNVEEFVEAAIDSLKAQSLPNFEALLINDGSTDASALRAQQAIQGDPRFKLVTQGNQGLSGARNTGLELARGEYVAFLDGDDAYAPEFLETQLNCLLANGANWSACGIRLMFPEAVSQTHPAMHPCLNAAQPGAQLLDMRDARIVGRQFPSAWNKLYRRSLIGDLRFPGGTWFEDHEFYWAYAAKADAMAYCPAPLYLHRRDRPGQITGTDSDRVFEQFDVLRRLKPLVESAGFEQAQTAYAQLVTRLVYERLHAIRDRERRARFLQAAVAFFQEHGLSFSPGDDPEAAQAGDLALALGATPSLAILLMVDEPWQADLRTTLSDPIWQSLPNVELLVVSTGNIGQLDSVGRGACRVVENFSGDLADLAASVRSDLVTLCAPWERPDTDGLGRLSVALAQGRGDWAMGGILQADGAHHDGWRDNRVVPEETLRAARGRPTQVALDPEGQLRAYPALGNRVWRRDLIVEAGKGLPLARSLTDVQLTALRLGLGKGEGIYSSKPAMQLASARPTASLPLRDDQWGSIGADLPKGWRRVVALRLAQLGQRRMGIRVLAAIALRGGLFDSAKLPVDPETPWWIRRILRLLGRQ